MINKRAVYYSLLGSSNHSEENGDLSSLGGTSDQNFKTTDELDAYICDLCQILQCPRKALGIQVSAKGLMAGASFTSVDTVEYIQIPGYFANAETYEEIGDKFTGLKTVIVVEKETVFQRLVLSPWFNSLAD